MPQHILFLTGRLAEKSHIRVLEGMAPTDFTWEVRDIGISVAGLMTAEMIRRRVTDLGGAQRVLVPGRCRGDVDALSAHFGVPVERGPEELKDIPRHFGRQAKRADLSRHAVTIFAEIVDAPRMEVAAIVARAARYRSDGADVIDLGCLPDTPFPRLAEAVRALKAEGYAVSVDSLAPEDLIAGGQAGADYLLSLKEDSLWVAEEVESTPILIPATPGDLDSLCRAWESLAARGRRAIADSILEPIHFGFTESILRYRELRQRLPEAEIMMGIGNLTELTEADTSGINALLAGIMSELSVGHVLTTEVSPHCRRAVREFDLARRLMFAAREEHALPKGYTDELTALHERRPFPDSPEEIAETAARVKDPSYRVQVSAAGIHVYNRDGLHTATDPFELYPRLALAGDPGHAFYLGVELARAQIAHQLGKRYSQDQELGWGCAVDRPAEDASAYTAAGSTLSHAIRKPGD